VSQQSSRLIPVSVLTGFLGSGKTTVLNYLTQQEALSRTLVIINEFGEVGLDHDLISKSVDDVVIEMASGCLCCTIRGDLVRTLRQAPQRFAREGKLWFDRVVIETTGLADPAPILHTLMTDPSIARHYRLDGVITTVDAVNGSDTLVRQEESVKQAAVADRLLITKTDLVEPDTLSHLQAQLREINPSAQHVLAVQGEVDAPSLFDAGLYNPETKSPDVQRWLKAEAYHEVGGHDDHHHHHDHDHDHHHNHHHDVNRHDERIRAVCYTIDEPIRSSAFEAWLDSLLMFRGADFLRVKGILNLVEQDQPTVIHGVQHIFHPPITLPEWPSADRRSRIVFITRDVDESVLRDTFNMFVAPRNLKWTASESA
jgi:G3E family GTPase